MKYSKTLDVKDYQQIAKEVAIIDSIQNKLLPVFSPRSVGPTAFGHSHRRWEYGTILNACLSNNTSRILDVGGFASIFASCAGSLGMDTTIIDPVSQGIEQTKMQKQALDISNIRYISQDFFTYDSAEKYDAVCCISVLEHVPDDVEFFKKLAEFVKKDGLLAITTDFYPTGEVRNPGHIRTYNEQRLKTLLNSIENFEVYGEEMDYRWINEDVFNYTFASMVLRKC